MSTTQHFPRRSISLQLLILLLVFFSAISPSKSDDLQLQSLVKFKSFLDKSNTRVFDTWIPQNSACNFTGIVCGPDLAVKEINLSHQNLTGTLPFDSICALRSLEKLSLGNNTLYGIITEDLKNCTQLQYLDLSVNLFSGQAPDLSSLSQLQFLNLNLSGFSGQFPWKSLENLTGLNFLSLGDNPFDRSSFPREILKLQKLYWLYLTNCSLVGTIPDEIGNLTQLQHLELSNNQLFGEIPSGITKLTSLQVLELYENRLTGKLPIGFGNLTVLQCFDASANSLKGDISELKSLTQLSSLQLFENQFSGEIPVEVGNFKSLTQLSLYANEFTGSLPEMIGSWADFEYIDVSDNFLTGPIPPYMCKQGNLTDLLMLNNKLTGGIPATYSDCSSLVRLRVKNNSLSGSVPAGIWGLPELGIIDLTLNQFEGPVTANIAGAKSLGQLFLSNNQFSGELPTAISQASSLVDIQLTSNQFFGAIPATIGELKKLSNLHFEDNKFSGTIPDSLGSCLFLSYINLAGNLLSGEIPAAIGSSPTLNSLNLSNNKLSGEIPASLTSLKLSLLDLSNNRLTGQIPESLITVASNGSFAGNPGLCSQSIRNFRPCSSNSGMSDRVGAIVYCFVAGGALLVASLACFIYFKIRHKDQDRLMRGGDSWNMKQFHVLSFTEEEVLGSIKQENLIGKGGSGNVYKVTLGSGKHLAVKHIWKSDSGDGNSCRNSSAMLPKGKSPSPEYDAEVATLSSVRHLNVVKLYCSISSEDWNLLVYEYMPNGSLWDRLHTCRKKDMHWVVRYEIAVGSARGLEYLHHGCDRPVIHRDVKSSNILLDEDMRPRIADFGLARILQAKGAKDSIHTIAGTLGYMAPEYAYTSKINEKSDVYSFGVVLMELVTGKRPIEPVFGENKDIVQWVCSKLRTGDRTADLVDSDISEDLKEDAAKVLTIAIHCTGRTPALRPSMRMVVQMLEEVEPCTFSSIIVNQRE